MCCPWVALIDDFEVCFVWKIWFFCITKQQNWSPKTNATEVADWFSVPLKWLMDERNLQIVKFPGWTSYEWTWIRPSDNKEFRIWGLSGAILLYLLVSAFKLTPKGVDMNAYLRMRNANIRKIK